MSELLDDVWTLVIRSNKCDPPGLCREITARWYRVTEPDKAGFGPVKPCGKETLAEILQDYSPDTLRDACEQARKYHAELEQAAKEREAKRLAAEKARQAAVEWELCKQKEAAEQARKQAEYERYAWPVIGPKHVRNSNPPFQRRPSSDTDGALLRDYPGIRPDAIRLILAAMGHAKGSQATEPPMILLTGIPGAGKTHTVHLTANIACVECWSTELVKDADRFLGSFKSAASDQRILFLDELEGGRVRERRLSSHLPKLAGGSLAPVVLACKTILPVFWIDRALARRLVHVDLSRGAVGHDWSGNPVQSWRSKNPDAADGLVGEVLDRFFREPRTWEQMVRELGFSFLTAHREQEVRDFAASLPGASDGWRVFVPRKGVSGAGAVKARFEQIKQVLVDEGCEIIPPHGNEPRTFIRIPPHLSPEQEGVGISYASPRKATGVG